MMSYATMSEKTVNLEELCFGCVFYPPNLPREAYSQMDWELLRALQCSFEHVPGGDDCLAVRKTSCNLIDLS
jgi:hypothetical protein